MQTIYLDNAASAPIDPDVLEHYIKVSKEVYGNASGLHSAGRLAADIIEDSREKIAGILSCLPEEIYFTSGGTESNNLALKGFCLANSHKGKHIIISAAEHDCIRNTATWLKAEGFRVSLLPVDSRGNVSSDDLKSLITRETILISVMHVNNETGTVQPVKEIGKIAEETGVVFHTDACQSFGKIITDNGLMKAGMISLNSHKIYGPKGIGALMIKNGIVLRPLLHGGGQEKDLRSGTENIPAIAAFAKAAVIAQDRIKDESQRILRLRRLLISRLENEIAGFYLNGDPENTVPGILNVSFSGLEGEAIRLQLLLDEKGIFVSTGSACSSNHGSGSHVLEAMGRNPFEARGALRISIGRFNTENEIHYFFDCLKEATQKLNPIYSL